MVAGGAPADRRAAVTSSLFVVTYVAISLPVVGVGLLADATDLVEAGTVFAGLVALLAAGAALSLVRSQRADVSRDLGSERLEHVSGDLRESRADQRAGQHVAGVVDAGVHARVRDHRGQRAQWRGGPRGHVAHAGRERERAGGVPRGKRARRGHRHVARRPGPRRPGGRGAASAPAA